MDPLLLAVEWWWVVPTAVAAGTAGAVGLRRRRSTVSGRRLEVEAARHDLRTAQRTLAERRAAVKIARAELVRTTAERAAQRATAEHVASARRVLRERERDLKAVSADARARRVRLNAARAAIPSVSEPSPLDRLHARHEAVTVQWMRYETDPWLQIAYPTMIDVKRPATTAYFRAAGHAVEMRRAIIGRITPTEFAAYRDAVGELERTFEAAEHAAKVQAGEVPPNAAWQDTAQEMLSRSAEALDRAAGAAASALSSWTHRKRPGKPNRRS